jgi:DNA polymerase III subunit delta'
MPFSEILGHSRQLETLCRALAKGQLHHGYLFLGPEGVGKKTLAISLAKAIHCSEAESDFCGQCADCTRIQTGNHPDVRVIEPLSGKKEISIQQIREVEKELNFRSFVGKKKIAVFDPATLINWPAQNALLKTLEEPPQGSLLILVSTSAGGLLPTLRSRCLSLSFGSLPRDMIATVLQSRRGIQQQEAEFLAALAMGSLGKALGLDSGDWLKKRQAWMEKLCALSSADYRAAAVLAEELAGNREEALRFLDWAKGWFRDLLVYRVTENREAVCNLDMLPQIQKSSTEVDLERILSCIAQTEGAAPKIQRNLNRRMVLEKLFFDVVGER